MRNKEVERALQKNMMELHLKEFEEQYLPQLKNLSQKGDRNDVGDENSANVKEGEMGVEIGEDGIVQMIGTQDQDEKEEEEALSEEELMNRRIHE